MNTSKFVTSLIENLPESSNETRDVWANKIISEKIPIAAFLPLLELKFEIASRTLWLFSQIALIDSDYLKPNLGGIYAVFDAHKIKGGETSIVNQWLICGIPEEMETLCIDQLFEWISSNETSATTKSRSIKTLLTLLVKYPELKNEMRIHLEDLNDSLTDSFRKFVRKTILTISN